MSLGIAFKGAEGIVLAADSRVTLTSVIQQNIPNTVPQQMLIPVTFDNATKLLKVKAQTHIGAITFGAGSIGTTQPRTAASFMPEFEDELVRKKGKSRISVEEFATELGEFFLAQWTKGAMPNPAPPGNEMVFLVGGYDVDAPYGRIFHVVVPTTPKPSEIAATEFGATWGGQRELTDRLLQGFDPNLPTHVTDVLKTPASQQKALEDELKKRLTLPIPWQFLPLQDCVDLCILLIRTTIQLQQWLVAVRGVGGAIDVATITRTDGFRAVQIKELKGELKAERLVKKQEEV